MISTLSVHVGSPVFGSVFRHCFIVGIRRFFAVWAKRKQGRRMSGLTLNLKPFFELALLRHGLGCWL